MRLQEVMVDTDRERMRWYTSQANELWNAIAFYSPLWWHPHRRSRKIREGTVVKFVLRLT